MSCPFCDIVHKTAPANIVSEDLLGGCIAIMDIKPINRGHVIVIPSSHAPTLDDLNASDEAALFKLAVKVARQMDDAYGCTGVNILVNNGTDAGQVVPHVHVHVIPRYPADGFRFKAVKHHQPTPQELIDDAAKLKKLCDSVY